MAGQRAARLTFLAQNDAWNCQPVTEHKQSRRWTTVKLVLALAV